MAKNAAQYDALQGKPAPVLLIDASGLIFRAFYSIRELSSPGGIPINAVYGFLLMFLKVVQDVQPKGCAAFFDTARRTFRSEQFEQYKANRPAPPDELKHQFPVTIEGMEACDCPALLEPGFEADDLIATYAEQHPGEFQLILTGDRDMLQLLDANTYVVMQAKGVTEVKVWTPENFHEEYGFAPGLFVDYKALRGDPSDNIPGVKGVGEKTAAKLVAEFGGLEDIYARLEEVQPERIREALRAAKGEVFGYRELVSLHKDIPIPPEHENIRNPQFTRPEFIVFLDKYGLKHIKKQVEERRD
jgi:DNA polymerase-1